MRFDQIIRDKERVFFVEEFEEFGKSARRIEVDIQILDSNSICSFYRLLDALDYLEHVSQIEEARRILDDNFFNRIEEKCLWRNSSEHIFCRADQNWQIVESLFDHRNDEVPLRDARNDDNRDGTIRWKILKRSEWLTRENPVESSVSEGQDEISRRRKSEKEEGAIGCDAAPDIGKPLGRKMFFRCKNS